MKKKKNNLQWIKKNVFPKEGCWNRNTKKFYKYPSDKKYVRQILITQQEEIISWKSIESQETIARAFIGTINKLKWFEDYFPEYSSNYDYQIFRLKPLYKKKVRKNSKKHSGNK